MHTSPTIRTAPPSGIAPGWLHARLSASLDQAELPALLERAPLDARVNTLKAPRAAALAELPMAARCAGEVDF